MISFDHPRSAGAGLLTTIRYISVISHALSLNVSESLSDSLISPSDVIAALGPALSKLV